MISANNFMIDHEKKKRANHWSADMYARINCVGEMRQSY